jgi:hypothetical protein
MTNEKKYPQKIVMSVYAHSGDQDFSVAGRLAKWTE